MTISEVHRLSNIFAEMESPLGFVLWGIVEISGLVAWASAGVHFSSLPNTMGVIATINSSTTTTLPNVAMAGIDQVVVSWWVKQSSTPADSEYMSVKVKLCFAPVSQVDRTWRKTNDDLNKDKTCQFDIIEQPYRKSTTKNNTTTWTVKRDVPKGTYFVRAYAFNALGSEVAYGQSTNKNKTSNLFMVDPISGRHVSLDITTAVFSAFSILSLFGFFIVEKWGASRASQKN